MPPIALVTSEYRSSTARVSIWYWNTDCSAVMVSVCRSTLLPSGPPGAADTPVVGATAAPEARLPSASAVRSELSKSTVAARKPGVSTLEMLSAVTRWRRDSPSSAVRSVDATTSVAGRGTAGPFEDVHQLRRRSVGGGERSVLAGQVGSDLSDLSSSSRTAWRRVARSGASPRSSGAFRGTNRTWNPRNAPLDGGPRGGGAEGRPQAVMSRYTGTSGVTVSVTLAASAACRRVAAAASAICRAAAS